MPWNVLHKRQGQGEGSALEKEAFVWQVIGMLNLQQIAHCAIGNRQGHPAPEALLCYASCTTLPRYPDRRTQKA